jgi:hypothetical protein
MASIACGTRLLAQDCGMACQETEPDCSGVSEISIMFQGLPQCGCPQCGCAQSGCTCARPTCGEYACSECGRDECICNQYDCRQAACDQGDCEQGNCNPDGCNSSGCNSDDCNPYTYYQLREDWRKAHGPILNTVRCLHNSCPFKHHKHNGNAAAQQRAAQTPWHGNYYYPQWGAPVALVVPPTAEFQTNYSWGVPASRISPIDAQFTRNFPGWGPGVVGGTGFLPPPQQPSDTNQIGVYYVRGPW